MTRVDHRGIFANARAHDDPRVLDFVPLKQAFERPDRKLADGKSDGMLFFHAIVIRVLSLFGGFTFPSH
jgi:hypothetical protein